jgi:NADH dehydrogenase FAD-containing subunit
MHEILPKIKSVLIAGAGPVGVETAGEIAHFYPDVKITIVSAGEILNGLKPGVISKAKQLLKGAKAEVLTNKRVKDHSTVDGSTKVELDDGSSRTVDLFIDARGASKINTEFLPKSWLDKTGRVTTRDSYFRVKGDGQVDVSGIYVVGDIVSGSTNTAIEMDAQVNCAGSSFAVDVAKKSGHDTSKGPGLLSYIPLIGSSFGSGVPTQKEFKPMKDTMMVPFGPTGGVGQMFGWGAPSFLVKKGKSEKFLIELVEPHMAGTKYAKLS